MTTTDTLALYAALHAAVPETRPKIYDQTKLLFAESLICRCRCATLSWVATTLDEMAGWRPRVHEGECDDCWCALDDWVSTGASDDAELIHIARRVHELQKTKGAKP